MRRGLRHFSVKDNFLVFNFEDGKNAFQQITLSKPDLILCDYRLPDTSGLEILQCLRKTDLQTPFFLITGYFKEEISISAKLNGANEVMEKPLDLNLLKVNCQKVLQ